MRLVDIIKKPLVTEKATASTREKTQVLFFEVLPAANKRDIARAVEQLFGVLVQKVRTLRVPSKQKRRGMFVAVRNVWKKAMVTLREGHHINLHEGI